MPALIGERLEEIFQGIKKRPRFIVAIDHTNTLLKEARRYRQLGKQDLALLLYAMWIEHFLNGIVEGTARKRGLKSNEVVALIRDTPLKAKTSWTLSLLNLPRIAIARQRQIDHIMQLRNAFVHYKWNYRDSDEKEDREKTRTALSEIQSLITYLRNYERKHVLHHSRIKLEKMIDRGMAGSPHDPVRQRLIPLTKHNWELGLHGAVHSRFFRYLLHR